MNYDLFEQNSIKSKVKLKKLQSLIYQQYASLREQENQEQQQKQKQTNQLTKLTKKFSLNLQNKRVKNFMIFSKSNNQQLKLPNINQKVSVLSRSNTITDLVADPFLNGRIKNQRQTVYNNIEPNHDLYCFLKTVEKYQYSFIDNCVSKKYKQAQQIILRLLNYTIDLNLIDYLCYSFKILGDFHIECGHIEKAFFYYNEGRKCSFIIDHQKLMIDCLLKMSLCMNRSNMFSQSIKILKKALQYVWYFDHVNLQLRVYDEMGKTYFMMGNSERAKSCHQKYFSAMGEPKNSSIRLLSKQSLILEGYHERKIIRSINTVFLWMIQAPIKSNDILQSFGVAEKTQRGICSLRKIYAKDMKYFDDFKTLKQAILSVFKQEFFKNQIEDLHLQCDDWTSPIRQRKFLSYDIQRNNHLKQLGIPIQNYFGKNKKPSQIKLRKVLRVKTQPNQNKEIKQLKLSTKVDVWYSKIATEAFKKHHNKNQSISNRVQLRGLDKQPEPRASIFRLLYNQYFSLFQVPSPKSPTKKQK